MSDSEHENQPLTIEIKTIKEEEIFDKKPKGKRTLTEKQKKALADGRQRAKAKRDLKIKEEAKVQAMKEIKKQQKDIEKAQKLNTKQKETKKKKLTQQETAREKVKEFERLKNIKKYNDVKSTVLEKMESVAEFDAMSRILDNINDEDIQDPKKMKAKLSSYITSVKNYTKTKVK